MSPNFDGGTPIKYEKGIRITVPEAQISDKQCDFGLHILQFGHRPEWYGLCRADHDLIAITVEILVDDLCFAGLPTMDGKLRVRSLIPSE